MDFTDIIKQFGPSGLFFCIVWALGHTYFNHIREQFGRFDKEREAATNERNRMRELFEKEREGYRTIQLGYLETITRVTENQTTFQDQVNKAHEAQMHEHQEMIQVLGRINGYKHE